jgi:hypothetical protein
MNMMHAFGITEEDVETVLRANRDKIVDTQVTSFERIASSVFGGIDAGRVAVAALKGGTEIEEQTDAAHKEIQKILVEDGVLQD